ncbi:MAG: hypothetical protein HYX24_07630 [Candidatus Aenigmarchaeota archaeon]|nr:hypothetical protein [Candidatus Aenigmarchaeota archaeon]
MLRYALKRNEKKSAKAYGRNLDLSRRKAAIVCQAIRGRQLEKAKRLLEDMVEGKRNLEGKFYTKTAKTMLNLLKSAEANADAKGLDAERLVVHATAHQGVEYRSGRRFKMHGDTRKFAHVQVVLEEK